MKTRLLVCFLIMMIIILTIVSSFALLPSKPISTDTPTPTIKPQVFDVSTGKQIVKIDMGSIAFVKFTAPSSDTYIFTSTGADDTYGYLYRSLSSDDCIKSDDDSGDFSNFELECSMNKNESIYLGIKFFNPDQSGSVPINISKKNTTQVTKQTSNPIATPKWPIGRKCLVHDSNGRARKGPGTNNAVVGTVNRGEIYEILDCKLGNTEKDWYKVKLKDNTIAWISSGIVDVDGNYFGTKNGEPIFSHQ